MPRVSFVLPDGGRRELDGESGRSLLEIAWRHDLPVEGACEGSIACATCHVMVDPAWHDRLPPPGEEEADLLDLIPGLTATSRLGCQIVLTPALDGLVVRLPAAARSLLDL